MGKCLWPGSPYLSKCGNKNEYCVCNVINIYMRGIYIFNFHFSVSCLRSVTSRPFITCSLRLSSSSSSAHWQWTTLTRAGVFVISTGTSLCYKKWVVTWTLAVIQHILIACDIVSYFRLVLEFDLFFYAFGKLGTVIWAWFIMFSFTLLGPYHILSQWMGLYHHYRWKVLISVATAMVLLAAQMSVLGYFPVYVVLHYQLPPASRFIVILEQVLWEYNKNESHLVCSHLQPWFQKGWGAM